jgi:2-(1,2-epoxy-1,2-dihydrophenyl)acetyl-CoA isomerase
VNKVVKVEDLEKVTREFAERFSKAATRAIGLMKRAMEQSLGLNQAIENQIYASLLAMETEDVKEGVAAFIEKREPQFKGK